MVSGKPPRHSKSKAEPVTIDLDAKDVKAISAEGDAARTDDKPSDQTPAAKAEPSVEETKPVAAAADPAPVWDQPKNPPRARTECRQDGLSACRTEGGKPCGQAKRVRFTSCRTAKSRCQTGNYRIRGERLFGCCSRFETGLWLHSLHQRIRQRRRSCKTLTDRRLTWTGQTLHATTG